MLQTDTSPLSMLVQGLPLRRPSPALPGWGDGSSYLTLNGFYHRDSKNNQRMLMFKDRSSAHFY